MCGDRDRPPKQQLSRVCLLHNESMGHGATNKRRLFQTHKKTHCNFEPDDLHWQKRQRDVVPEQNLLKLSYLFCPPGKGMDLLSCVICYMEVRLKNAQGIYVALPDCTHGVCAECLLKLIQYRRRRCPICRTKLTMTKQDVVRYQTTRHKQ